MIKKYSNAPYSILALDPSLNCTGYSIFKNGELKDQGTIYFSSYVGKGKEKKTIGEKLFIIEYKLKELIEKHKIELLVMEKYILLFSQKGKKLNTSSTTAKLLPMVRGIIRKVIFETKIQYTEVWAGEIKKVLTGNGKAEKELVRDAINKMYNLSLKTAKELNISDAIGVGVAFFELHNLKIMKDTCVKDAVNFINEYHDLPSKTQKNLKFIGVDINRWKSLLK